MSASGPGVARSRRGAQGALLLLAAGCAQVRPQADFAQARQLVQESTGAREVHDPYAPALGPEAIEAILAEGLSLDEASRLALLNSRELRAEFLAIGVARADLVQAGLLSNPVLDLRIPFTGSDGTLEGLLGFELLELWRIPARKESARHELDATILRAARRAGELLAEVRGAYFAAVAADELARVAQEHLALVSASFSAVQALHGAGAADALDESLARGPLLSAELALRGARLEAAGARRELAKRLSLDGPVELQLSDALPEPAAGGPDAERLVALALTSRLDLRAMNGAVAALEAGLETERRRAWGDAAAGPAVERLGDGDSSVGGTLGVALPLFDRNQAQVARAQFELRRMLELRAGARLDVAQDVRAAVERRAAAAESLRFYREELLQQAERGLALAQESYSAGRSTLFALLEAQRYLLETRRGHVLARLEGASAQAELERELGCPLPDGPQP